MDSRQFSGASALVAISGIVRKSISANVATVARKNGFVDVEMEKGQLESAVNDGNILKDAILALNQTDIEGLELKYKTAQASSTKTEGENWWQKSVDTMIYQLYLDITDIIKAKYGTFFSAPTSQELLEGCAKRALEATLLALLEQSYVAESDCIALAGQQDIARLAEGKNIAPAELQTLLQNARNKRDKSSAADIEDLSVRQDKIVTKLLEIYPASNLKAGQHFGVYGRELGDIVSDCVVLDSELRANFDAWTKNNSPRGSVELGGIVKKMAVLQAARKNSFSEDVPEKVSTRDLRIIDQQDYPIIRSDFKEGRAKALLADLSIADQVPENYRLKAIDFAGDVIYHKSGLKRAEDGIAAHHTDYVKVSMRAVSSALAALHGDFNIKKSYIEALDPKINGVAKVNADNIDNLLGRAIVYNLCGAITRKYLTGEEKRALDNLFNEIGESDVSNFIPDDGLSWLISSCYNKLDVSALLRQKPEELTFQYSTDKDKSSKKKTYFICNAKGIELKENDLRAANVERKIFVSNTVPPAVYVDGIQISDNIIGFNGGQKRMINAFENFSTERENMRHDELILMPFPAGFGKTATSARAAAVMDNLALVSSEGGLVAIKDACVRAGTPVRRRPEVHFSPSLVKNSVVAADKNKPTLDNSPRNVMMLLAVREILSDKGHLEVKDFATINAVKDKKLGHIELVKLPESVNIAGYLDLVKHIPNAATIIRAIYVVNGCVPNFLHIDKGGNSDDFKSEILQRWTKNEDAVYDLLGYSWNVAVSAKSPTDIREGMIGAAMNLGIFKPYKPIYTASELAKLANKTLQDLSAAFSGDYAKDIKYDPEKLFALAAAARVSALSVVIDEAHSVETETFNQVASLFEKLKTTLLEIEYKNNIYSIKGINADIASLRKFKSKIKSSKQVLAESLSDSEHNLADKFGFFDHLAVTYRQQWADGAWWPLVKKDVRQAEFSSTDSFYPIQAVDFLTQMPPIPAVSRHASFMMTTASPKDAVSGDVYDRFHKLDGINADSARVIKIGGREYLSKIDHIGLEDYRAQGDWGKIIKPRNSHTFKLGKNSNGGKIVPEEAATKCFIDMFVPDLVVPGISVSDSNFEAVVNGDDFFPSDIKTLQSMVVDSNLAGRSTVMLDGEGMDDFAIKMAELFENIKRGTLDEEIINQINEKINKQYRKTIMTLTGLRRVDRVYNLNERGSHWLNENGTVRKDYCDKFLPLRGLYGNSKAVDHFVSQNKPADITIGQIKKLIEGRRMELAVSHIIRKLILPQIGDRDFMDGLYSIDKAPLKDGHGLLAQLRNRNFNIKKLCVDMRIPFAMPSYARDRTSEELKTGNFVIPGQLAEDSRQGLVVRKFIGALILGEAKAIQDALKELQSSVNDKNAVAITPTKPAQDWTQSDSEAFRSRVVYDGALVMVGKTKKAIAGQLGDDLVGYDDPTVTRTSYFDGVSELSKASGIVSAINKNRADSTEREGTKLPEISDAHVDYILTEASRAADFDMAHQAFGRANRDPMNGINYANMPSLKLTKLTIKQIQAQYPDYIAGSYLNEPLLMLMGRGGLGPALIFDRFKNYEAMQTILKSAVAEGTLEEEEKKRHVKNLVKFFSSPAYESYAAYICNRTGVGGQQLQSVRRPKPMADQHVINFKLLATRPDIAELLVNVNDELRKEFIQKLLLQGVINAKVISYIPTISSEDMERALPLLLDRRWEWNLYPQQAWPQLKKQIGKIANSNNKIALRQASKLMTKSDMSDGKQSIVEAFYSAVCLIEDESLIRLKAQNSLGKLNGWIDLAKPEWLKLDSANRLVTILGCNFGFKANEIAQFLAAKLDWTTVVKLAKIRDLAQPAAEEMEAFINNSIIVLQKVRSAELLLENFKGEAADRKNVVALLASLVSVVKDKYPIDVQSFVKKSDNIKLLEAMIGLAPANEKLNIVKLHELAHNSEPLRQWILDSGIEADEVRRLFLNALYGGQLPSEKQYLDSFQHYRIETLEKLAKICNANKNVVFNPEAMNQLRSLNSMNGTLQLVELFAEVAEGSLLEMKEVMTELDEFIATEAVIGKNNYSDLWKLMGHAFKKPANVKEFISSLNQLSKWAPYAELYKKHFFSKGITLTLDEINDFVNLSKVEELKKIELYGYREIANKIPPKDDKDGKVEAVGFKDVLKFATAINRAGEGGFKYNLESDSDDSHWWPIKAWPNIDNLLKLSSSFNAAVAEMGKWDKKFLENDGELRALIAAIKNMSADLSRDLLRSIEPDACAQAISMILQHGTKPESKDLVAIKDQVRSLVEAEYLHGIANFAYLAYQNKYNKDDLGKILQTAKQKKYSTTKTKIILDNKHKIGDGLSAYFDLNEQWLKKLCTQCAASNSRNVKAVFKQMIESELITKLKYILDSCPSGNEQGIKMLVAATNQNDLWSNLISGKIADVDRAIESIATNIERFYATKVPSAVQLKKQTERYNNQKAVVARVLSGKDREIPLQRVVCIGAMYSIICEKAKLDKNSTPFNKDFSERQKKIELIVKDIIQAIPVATEQGQDIIHIKNAPLSTSAMTSLAFLAALVPGSSTITGYADLPAQFTHKQQAEMRAILKMNGQKNADSDKTPRQFLKQSQSIFARGTDMGGIISSWRNALISVDKAKAELDNVSNIMKSEVDCFWQNAQVAHPRQPALSVAVGSSGSLQTSNALGVQMPAPVVANVNRRSGLLSVSGSVPYDHSQTGHNILKPKVARSARDDVGKQAIAREAQIVDKIASATSGAVGKDAVFKARVAKVVPDGASGVLGKNSGALDAFNRPGKVVPGRSNRRNSSNGQYY